MDANELDDQTAIKLAAALNNNSSSQLSVLSLWRNKITEKGWRSLVASIERSYRFTSLNHDDETMSSELSSRLKQLLATRKLASVETASPAVGAENNRLTDPS